MTARYISSVHCLPVPLQTRCSLQDGWQRPKVLWGLINWDPGPFLGSDLRGELSEMLLLQVLPTANSELRSILFISSVMKDFLFFGRQIPIVIPTSKTVCSGQ